MEIVTQLTKIKRHNELVALGKREAELQRILDEERQILPLLADKDCGLSRAAVTALVSSDHVRRSWNTLGDAVHLTHRGFAYLAAHRGDPVDADLVERSEQLLARVAELRAQNKALKRIDWVSGQLGRATDAEIRLLEFDLADLRAQRRRRAGDNA